MNDAYEILSGKTKVAVWRDERLTVLNPDLLPLYLKMNQNLKAWLTTRAADNRRPHIRLLKKALRLAERDDISTVIHVNGATITDNYWIRPLGSDLTYDDVRFTDDYFSNLALKGNYDSFNRAASSKRSKTPELTNIGSFEKCWKLRDGQWWMFKRATHDVPPFQEGAAPDTPKVHPRKTPHDGQKMLSEGERPTAVCTRCGFSDYTTFYRNYVGFFGCPPSEREKS